MADASMSVDGLSLAALRLKLAPALAAAAAFDGWTPAAVAAAAAAAADAGVDPAVAAYAFADGPMAMIAAWIGHVDLAMAAALSDQALAAMSVRARIAGLLRARLDAQRGAEEALRRAQAVMATPANLPHALKLGWQTADVIWRLAGDTATDLNHYTKRATLAAIYAATLAVFIDDTSADKAETLAFLDRRIAGVMWFEKTKARLLNPPGPHFSPIRLLGRLRYPAH